MAMKKTDYLRFSIKGVGSDRKIDRNEAKRIEKKNNDHSRFWIKMTNLGEAHGHHQRMIESKLNSSESMAPRYYMFKDHKSGRGWRPVVSGCSSGTLGLSNLISEVLESLCVSVKNPYEVISSTDMLSRVEEFNNWVKRTKLEKGELWDWRDEYMLIGSDVKALFPSLSADKTSKLVREQAEKINMEWENLDEDWLKLYIHLNRDIARDIKDIEHLLPARRKGRRGVEAGMGSTEAKEREIRGNSKESNWTWPNNKAIKGEVKKLAAIALEIVIKFFFENFVYTFGGEFYKQDYGGPIGARLTMAVSRLVMQSWYEEYRKILNVSNVRELLGGIYVDDGRAIVRKLELGTRFNEEKRKFITTKECKEIDELAEESRENLTEREFRKMMNTINNDLEFTTETEKDFQNSRLPTLSFELWSTENGLAHSYFEKEMRSQVLTMKRSSMPEKSKFSILVNELNRRFEVMSEEVTIDEKVSVINKFTQQLVNSGYSYLQTKEIVLSSLKGEITKKKRRKSDGGKRYLSNSRNQDKKEINRSSSLV